MIAIIAIVLLYFLARYSRETATEMPDTYEERRIWKKYKKGNKEYWRLHRVDGVWDTDK